MEECGFPNLKVLGSKHSRRPNALWEVSQKGLKVVGPLLTTKHKHEFLAVQARSQGGAVGAVAPPKTPAKKKKEREREGKK